MSYTVKLEDRLTGQRLTGHDFSGKDLANHDLHGSVFLSCCFDNANLTSANCEGSDFTNSTFRKSLLTRANFRNAKLSGVVFEPDDCYGITLTMDCKTFENVHIGQLWWYSWLVLMASTKPVSHPVKGSLTDGLIGLIGAGRYVKLKALFMRRDI